MRETQQTISAWIEETFGPVDNNLRVVARANEEMAEVLRCISAGRPYDGLGEECADVAICLCRLAARMGFDLSMQSAKLGPAGELVAVHAASANKAMAEMFLACCLRDDHPRIKDFAEDVIVCLDLAARHELRGFGTLEDEIDKKMAVNRARKWELDGTGCGYQRAEDSA
jgi:hypothetical protein